jgi:hypothetical protein
MAEQREKRKRPSSSGDDPSTRKRKKKKKRKRVEAAKKQPDAPGKVSEDHLALFPTATGAEIAHLFQTTKLKQDEASAAPSKIVCCRCAETLGIFQPLPQQPT